MDILSRSGQKQNLRLSIQTIGIDTDYSVKMRLTFKRMAFLVLGLYFLVTCYTGYMVIRRKLEKAGASFEKVEIVKDTVPVDDSDWNPWGQEFEREHQELPAFERPHLLLESEVNVSKTEEKLGQTTLPSQAQGSENVVEIWGKAAIGLYLWEHVLRGVLNSKLGGIWSYGSLTLDNLQFRFRTGPGVVPGKVPLDTVNLVLVVNGRAKDKIDFAKMWLDYLPNLPSLKNVAVMMLGDESCNNQWLHKYTSKHGGPVKMVFLIYDSPEIDDENFFQWPLGVATYRDFPVIVPGEISVKNKRTYTCNFLGSLYPNSSRVTLLKTLQASKQQSYCLIHARQEWVPKESSRSREDYIQALRESDLTLNPVGKNTECYRIYEAMSLGSLPVIEDVMTPGQCGGINPYPLRLLKQYGAPVIYVSEWKDINKLLETERHLSLVDVVSRRQKILKWYAGFLEKLKWRFVKIIQQKFFSSKR